MELFTKLFGPSLSAFVCPSFRPRCPERLPDGPAAARSGGLLAAAGARNRGHYQRSVSAPEPTLTSTGWRASPRQTGGRDRWHDEGIRMEDYVRPYLRSMERHNRFGVYFIFQAMERGSSFGPCGW